MANPLDSMPAENASAKYSSKDVEIAVKMGIKLIKDGGGLKIIADGINKSQDPARVVGQFLAQVMGKLAEMLRSEYGINPGIFLAKDGWLDIILDWIEKQLGYPNDFSDKVYAQTLETIKAAAMEPPPANDAMGGKVVVAGTDQAGQPDQGMQGQPQAPTPPTPPEAMPPQGAM